MKLINNEIVFRGQPDKLADQIADQILMKYLEQDKESRVDIDVVGGEGVIFVTGDVYSSSSVDVLQVIKDVLNSIGGYPRVDVIDEIRIHTVQDYKPTLNTEQSEDSVMFGYASNETSQLLPKAVVILQEFAEAYQELCEKDIRFLHDGKIQLTGLYDDNGKLTKIKSANINHQNNGEDKAIRDNIIRELLSKIAKKYDVTVDMFIINPLGAFPIGGFERDTGLTGRKTVVDSYQGFAPVGEGKFSGKNPKNINRAATHKAREIAKSLLSEHKLDWCEVQLLYTNGVDKPLTIYANSNIGIVDIEESLYEECTSENIVKDLDLLNKDYFKMSAFGHFRD